MVLFWSLGLYTGTATFLLTHFCSLVQSSINKISSLLQFIVVKFLRQDDQDDTLYEVALSSWLVEGPDEQMKGVLKWPQSDSEAGKLVRRQAAPRSDWRELDVIIKKYYSK